MKRDANGQFVKDGLDFVNGDYEDLRHALVEGHDEHAVSQRDVEQEETRRQAQAELLDVDSLSEFRQAREAFPLLIIEPDVPLESMSLSDYRASLEREKRMMERPNLELGEMSLKDFRLARKQQR